MESRHAQTHTHTHTRTRKEKTVLIFLMDIDLFLSPFSLSLSLTLTVSLFLRKKKKTSSIRWKTTLAFADYLPDICVAFLFPNKWYIYVICIYTKKHFGCENPFWFRVLSWFDTENEWVSERKKKHKVKLFSTCGPKKHHRIHAEWKFCLYDFGFTEIQASDRKSIAAIQMNATNNKNENHFWNKHTLNMYTYETKQKPKIRNMFNHEKWMNLSNTRWWRLYVHRNIMVL